MKIKDRDLSQPLLKIVPLLVAAYIIISIVSICTPYAQDCYAPFPNYIDGKLSFFRIKVRDLTKTEKEILIKNFKSLPRSWAGEAIEEKCTGSVESPSKERILYSIKAEIETDYFGNLKLNTVFDSKDNNTVHSEKINLYLADNKLRFNDDSGYGDVKLLEVTNSKIRFLKRYSGATLGRVYFVTLSFGDNSFSFETIVYVGGKFSFQINRNFTEKKYGFLKKIPGDISHKI
ncbi:MAG: hypothetical protein GY874_12000 [Desulfobacteraceae bacterium]|nr:hypothetical protein [Desulfobacteraceae bacterium]